MVFRVPELSFDHIAPNLCRHVISPARGGHGAENRSVEVGKDLREVLFGEIEVSGHLTLKPPLKPNVTLQTVALALALLWSKHEGQQDVHTPRAVYLYMCRALGKYGPSFMMQHPPPQLKSPQRLPLAPTQMAAMAASPHSQRPGLHQARRSLQLAQSVAAFRSQRRAAPRCIAT